jgi:hypothetical protein
VPIAVFTFAVAVIAIFFYRETLDCGAGIPSNLA